MLTKKVSSQDKIKEPIAVFLNKDWYYKYNFCFYIDYNFILSI